MRQGRLGGSRAGKGSGGLWFCARVAFGRWRIAACLLLPLSRPLLAFPGALRRLSAVRGTRPCAGPDVE